MQGFIALFKGLVLRHATLHAGRTALTIASVAIGVALTVAVRMANASATESFTGAANTVAGGTALQIVADAGQIRDDFLTTVASVTGVESVSPIVSGSVAVSDSSSCRGVVDRSTCAKNAGFDLIGIDLVAAAGLAEREAAPPIEQHGGAKISADIFRRGRVVIGSGLAARLGLSLDSGFDAIAGNRSVALVVGGVVDDATLPDGWREVIFTDISTAQETLGKRGLDRIDVVPAAGQVPSALAAALRAKLPAGLRVTTPDDRSAALRKMTASFSFNLLALAAIALLVGAFLVYNAVAMSVVQRRAEIGVSRALGAPRALVFFVFACEGAAVGIVGSAAGLLAGRLLAGAALHVVGRTVDALYVGTSSSIISAPPGIYAGSFAFGVLLALVAAISPALEAARVLPTTAVRVGSWESGSSPRIAPRSALAVGAFALAAACVRLPAVDGEPLFGYAAALLVVFGGSLLAAPLVAASARVAIAATASWSSAALRLAASNLQARVRRNGIAVASLAIGVAMTVSVTTMIASFRSSVVDWIGQTARGDLYVRPSGAVNAEDAPMPRDLAVRVSHLPGVASVSTVRARLTNVGGRLAYVGAIDAEQARRFESWSMLGTATAADSLRSLVGAKRVIVSEPFASKFNLRSGDVVSLPTSNGPAAFTVANVFRDYSSDIGYAFMDTGVYRTLIGQSGIDGMAIFARSGTDHAALRAAVERALAGERVVVESSAELRAGALAQFDRTFAVTYALDAIVLTVALLGIVATLSAQVLERRQEIGVLRCIGILRREVVAMVVGEAAWLGVLGSLLGIAAGYVVAWILVFVVNKQAFGWTIDFGLAPLADLRLALAVIVTAAIAGLLPAAQAARVPAGEAVRAE
ncbi:MAG TPA: FtsX-like permease family protein [Candidatus Eremiobacteraceae bacterium]